ncbi:DUF397 domain-containing protein [Saccharopolyspora sp. ASAGF58]|uniref:DUF397 domain-containing protein n=1 Tax=Saccharopolyspora sp. ASAGF58 TaxID=2719023 RepID=UPI00143FCF10|nr:DUF397 domain-containing protein [Saccharopolyspora sp. ASAGF58]QIZ33909.1 DUF397 domain-containing protein [Saccharopolyspora sp. ASAGF58]
MNTHVADASELANVAWRRSSRSGSGGGACVEVGVSWRKSSYSGPNGGACVEVGMIWRKSSRSGHGGGQCVEVGLGALVTGVRDSKDPSGPALLFGADAWDGFLSGLKADRFDR